MTLCSSKSEKEITNHVNRLYETYSYPNYSIYFRPRIQEAFLSNSLFSANIASSITKCPSGIYLANQNKEKRVLVAGCGDMQPYIFSKWEPQHHRLTFLDQSKKSLQLAKLRIGLSLNSYDWVLSELNTYLSHLSNQTFHHIEAYGVLHHLAKPSESIALLSSHLLEHGTARIMIYNKVSRNWIHRIHSIFRLLKLSAYKKDDLKDSKDILNELFKHQALEANIKALGTSIFTKNSRLVDTFFHPREINWSITKWLNLFKSHNLKPIGIFDRYAELDDLENPLWCMPKASDLEERTLDGRFENNIEIFLKKESSHSSKAGASKETHQPAKLPYSISYQALPPKLWFQFKETRHINFKQRFLLWSEFKSCLQNNSDSNSFSYSHFQTESLQRLSRIGALLPSSIESHDLKSLIKKPLYSTMETPEKKKYTKPSNELIKKLERVAVKNNIPTHSKAFKVILLQLNKLIN